jgi:hypothetical protein
VVEVVNVIGDIAKVDGVSREVSVLIHVINVKPLSIERYLILSIIIDNGAILLL